jgi:plasmid stabilization system protein ParE
MKVVLSSLAARELTTVSAEYESKAPHLGSLFIDEFEDVVSRLGRFPLCGTAFGERFRRTILRRFPYLVVYAISGDVLRIVAIMHQHRGPDFIARRFEVEDGDGT